MYESTEINVDLRLIIIVLFFIYMCEMVGENMINLRFILSGITKREFATSLIPEWAIFLDI